jgi:hypothetical protein
MCVVASGAAEPAAAGERWRPLEFVIGSWTGTAKGQPGEGKVEREIRMVLGGRYLEIENRTTYAPQARNPKGEVHEDRGMVSWDRRRARFVLRQFNVEGYVNQFVADSVVVGADSVVFTTESIENIPPGWRARETWRKVGEDEFVERFELAEPNKGFEIYSESRLRRK